jgi:hypothetical protein
MSTERYGPTRLFTFEKKKCPSCGQAIGWRRSLWWNLIPTRWTGVRCPSCHARLRLRSSVLLAGLLIGAFITALDFATGFHMSEHPITVAIAFSILVFIVCPLFSWWFVSIELKGEKA